MFGIVGLVFSNVHVLRWIFVGSYNRLSETGIFTWFHFSMRIDQFFHQ